MESPEQEKKYRGLNTDEEQILSEEIQVIFKKPLAELTDDEWRSLPTKLAARAWYPQIEDLGRRVRVSVEFGSDEKPVDQVALEQGLMDRRKKIGAIAEKIFIQV